MNKIFQILSILFLLMTYAFTAQAKLNIFPQPRYIPALTFYGLDEQVYRLSDFESDLLIVVIWSRTCGPCIGELKNLDKFAEKVKDRGIKVILLSPESEWKTADEMLLFMKKVGAPHLVNYVDRKRNFINGMGIMVTPTALLVNRKTEEIGQITGVVKWDKRDVERYMIKLKRESLKDLEESETSDEQSQE